MISATVEELYSGAWVADTVDVVAPTGSFNLAGSDWAGTVLSQSKDGGRYYARIVGGKGKLSTALPDLWYDGTQVADTIAGQAIGEAGETLGSSTLGLRVDAWQRKAGTLGQCLSQIIDITGGVWWVSRSGNVFLAPSRASLELLPANMSTISTDVDGSVLVSPNTKLEQITPGSTWAGKVIKHVRWTLTPNNLTAALAFEELPSPPLTFDYLRTYSAKVDRQNADGSLDVIVDQTFSVSNVPWLSGVPAKVTIQGGDSVTVGWLGGDPRTPYAQGIGQTSGSKAAAGVGDTCDVGELYLQYGTGPLALAVIAVFYAPPRSNPLEPRTWLPCGVPGTVIPPTPVTPGVAALSALITSGFDRVKW